MSEFEFPKSLMSRKVEGLLFFLCSIIWGLFLFSSFKFQDRNWFLLLITARTLLSIIGIAGGVSVLCFKKENLLSSYFILSLVIQSIFSILEGSQQIQFYEYIAYLGIMASLSYHGTLSNWLKKYYSIYLLAVLVPLFFKDVALYSSIGNFLFNLTTTVVSAFLMIAIVGVTSSRYQALIENIKLRNQLFEEQSQQKMIVERELEKAKLKIAEYSKYEAISNLASQIAHDIRSPLSALNMLTSSLENVPEDKIQMLKAVTQRINDIANDLLKRGKAATKASLNLNELNASSDNNSALEDVDLYQILNSMVEEKKLQYSNYKNIEILFSSFGENFISNIDRSQVLRGISNLINNSIEAFPNQSGRVELNLSSNEKMNVIVIEDNGSGIPDSILNRIGERGFTSGKENSNQSGSGLGVFQAKKSVEQVGGLFLIESKLSLGTKITIQIPKR